MANFDAQTITIKNTSDSYEIFFIDGVPSEIEWIFRPGDIENEVSHVGLWFDGKELFDYDGVYTFPKAVIPMFEQLGYNMSYVKDDEPSEPAEPEGNDGLGVPLDLTDYESPAYRQLSALEDAYKILDEKTREVCSGSLAVFRKIYGAKSYINDQIKELLADDDAEVSQ